MGDSEMLVDMMTQIRGNDLLTGSVVLLLVLSTATVTAAYYQIHGPALHALFLLSLAWMVWRLWKGPPLAVGRATWLVVAPFLLYVLVAVLSAARVGFNPEALDRLEHFSYFLAAAVLIPVLVDRPPRADWFWYAIAATATLSGLHALWELYQFGLDHRAAGSKGKAIPFGDIATLAACLSLLAVAVFARTRRWLSGLFILAALLGVSASLASGTRGAWIFLPSAGLIICLYLLQSFPALRRTILWGALTFAIAATLALSQTGLIQQRFAQAQSEVRNYLAGAEVAPHDSLGERFEMWRAAWMAFQEHPVLGIGVGQLNGYFRQAAEQGRIAGAIAAYDDGAGHTHAHNDYLHVLATRGLLGLGSLLLLYLVPLGVFVRTVLTARERPARGLGYAGILTILGYIHFSLTDSILLMRITAGFFVLLCGWLLALNLTLPRDGTMDG